MGQHQEELARLQLEDRKKKAAEDAEAKKSAEATDKSCSIGCAAFIIFFIIVGLYATQCGPASKYKYEDNYEPPK